MPITIGSNIQAMRGVRAIGVVTRDLEAGLERLSSGQRINGASDDAAGLSIATTTDVRRRVLTQGIRNFNDGVSALQIADGTLQQLSGVLTRLEELSQQALSGPLGLSQRRALDTEAQQLRAEYSRLVESTQFNGLGLLNGSLSTLALQAGFGTDGLLRGSVGGARGTGQATQTQTITGATDIAETADLNGDGIRDILTASAGTVSIRLGNGDGTFAAATSFSSGVGNINSIALGDTDGDGDQDLVISGFSGLQVATNSGAGTLSSASIISGVTSTRMQLGDMDGDGRLDIVTGSGSTIQVRSGTGNNQFALTSTVSNAITGSYTLSMQSLRLADMNRDGLLDVIVGGIDSDFMLGSSAIVNTVLGRGNNTYQAQTTRVVAGDSSPLNGLAEIEVGDVSGDGNLDVIVLGSGVGVTEGIFRMLGDAQGQISSTAVRIASSSNAFTGIELRDMNGDNLLDLIAARSNLASGEILLGQGSGNFATEVRFSGTTNFNTGLVVADFNNDGVPDIFRSGVGAFRQDTLAGVQALQDFSLRTTLDSREALNLFRSARERISSQRGVVGALQSRLDASLSVLGGLSENLEAARSRIVDADMAKESAELFRLRTLQQSATAVLAQASIQPQLALRLLAG